MIKQKLKRKQYEKIKKYIEHEIKLEKGLMDNIEIPEKTNSEFYFKSVELHECHAAKIVCLKQILRFIEKEER